jgi:hypothetical protein
LNYLPNYYNRTTQPLSPYLNLFRGVSPGVNYYYGVRPGLPTGGVNVFGQAPAYQPFVGANAGGFLPQAAMPNDGSGLTYPTGGQPIVLRSAANNAIYGNVFGNHGGYQNVYANRGNQAQYAGQQRSSAQGLGASPPRK